jgi:PLP dependent protein
VVDLVRVDPAVVAANLARVRSEVGEGVEILAAIKYVELHDLPALAQAGVTLVGENRAQELIAKQAAHGPLFAWDFIGALQSRKVKDLVGRVRYIHSVASDSVLEQLGKHATPGTQVLIEVNVAGDASKSGIAPADLGAFIARCPVAVAGLMTMPPFTAEAEDNRLHFQTLTRLAEEHGLAQLSMGTSQDYRVAVEEGATIIRLGDALLSASAQ